MVCRVKKLFVWCTKEIWFTGKFLLYIVNSDTKYVLLTKSFLIIISVEPVETDSK